MFRIWKRRRKETLADVLTYVKSLDKWSREVDDRFEVLEDQDPDEIKTLKHEIAGLRMTINKQNDFMQNLLIKVIELNMNGNGAIAHSIPELPTPAEAYQAAKKAREAAELKRNGKGRLP